jgi:L-aspartate oxidase
LPKPPDVSDCPVIIGAGIAGLATALYLAPIPVLVINKGKFGSGSTGWAQGGIAAAIGADDDPGLHAEDTIRVGGGLVDPAIAHLVAEAAPRAIETLQRWGVTFDRDEAGNLMPGLEAGHSRKRIVHAGGDATGHKIIVALTETARRTPSITLREDTAALSLTRDEQGLTGVHLDHEWLATRRVVLATGGIGQLYAHTTNPPGADGGGLRLAAEAGAVLKDLEFVQFHPTAMDIGRDPMPLATEALRGQGARLITAGGRLVMAHEAAGDLSPRDVVARGIWRSIEAGERVFLDCRAIADFASRFPTVYASCRSAGIDPATTPVPVRPAAHYHMGGVEVDAEGRSSMPGLWACGEVACTGLHGANRLASNSLLEAIVLAERVARSITTTPVCGPALPPSSFPREGTGDNGQTIRALFDRYVGVTRDADGLQEAVRFLSSAIAKGETNAAIPLMIALGALRREESRGAHCRSDFPDTAADAVHSRMTLDEALEKLGTSRLIRRLYNQ